MAPPTVLSYFSRTHRRTGSSPQSPQSPQWHTAASFRGRDDSAASPASTFSFNPSANPSPATESPVSPQPPVLPPIRRVASSQEKESTSSDSRLEPDRPLSLAERVPAAPSTSAPPIFPKVSRIMTRKQPFQEPLKIKTIDTKLDTGYRRKDQLSDQAPEQQDTSTSPDVDIQGRPKSRSIQGTSSSLDQQPSNSGPSVLEEERSSRPISPTLSQNANDLQPPSNHTSRRASSPASSLSSIRRSMYSSNAPMDSSPASSKSAAQPANAPAPTRSSKNRMNLLNPVSLLRRRRTAQSTEHMPDGSYIRGPNLDVPAMDLPADYDPRIKGKGVHDFNAPRPRRHYSTTDAGLGIQVTGDVSPVEEYRRRSIVPSTANASKDASPREKEADNHEVSDKERVPVFVEHFEDEDSDQANNSAVQRESLANPSFLARMSRQLDFDSPELVSTNTATSNDSQQRAPAGERTSKSTVDAPSLRVSSDQSTARSSISNETRATSPTGSPSPKHQRGSLTLEAPFQPEGLPRHFPSTASRTSRFSFQLNSEDTLAQERALEEKGKERAAAKANESGSDGEDEYGSSGEDDMANLSDIDDDAYDEEPIPMVNVVDEEDENADEAQGFHYQYQIPEIHATNAEGDYPQAADLGDVVSNKLKIQPVTTTAEEEDLLYYDDGMIAEPISAASKPFDESLLDSDLESFKDARSHLESPIQDSQRVHAKASSSLLSMPTSSRSFEALSDYHDALAFAATKAEADGRFRRKSSVDISGSSWAESDGIRKTSESTAFEPHLDDWYQPVFEDSDLDGLEDDPMVAAANAEVLASEDSEFYGREFGFYGGFPDDEGEMYNGGYFRSTADELNRSASGRNAIREPNLTPITERSEFSTRNSFTSVRAWGSSQSIPTSNISRIDGQQVNPGLKELVANMNMDEDDMTLSQLMKLRKDTFGGRRGGSVGDASSAGSVPSDSPSMWHSPLSSQVVDEEDMPYQRDEFDTQYASYEQDSKISSQEEPSDLTTSLQVPLTSMKAGLKTPPASGSSETTPKPLSAFKSETMSLTDTEENPPVSPTPYSAPLPSIASFTKRRISIDWPSEVPLTQFSLPMSTSSAPSTPVTTTSSNLSAQVPPPGYHQYSNSVPLEMPMPPSELMQKFASRPPASSASFAERERQRNSYGQTTAGFDGFKSSSDSVAYVREDSNWYLERRRRLSSGELIVVGRKLVEGGRI